VAGSISITTLLVGGLRKFTKIAVSATGIKWHLCTEKIICTISVIFLLVSSILFEVVDSSSSPQRFGLIPPAKLKERELQKPASPQITVTPAFAAIVCTHLFEPNLKIKNNPIFSI
jgi:hypothetical protein